MIIFKMKKLMKKWMIKNIYILLKLYNNVLMFYLIYMTKRNIFLKF